VVLPAVDANGLFAFYTEVLGFLPRGAFRVPAPPEFGPVRVRFLGLNQRHHSLAICPAATLRDPGLIHLMVEVMRVDETYYTAEEITADSYCGHQWVSDLPAAMRP
jgi:3,4-dihydroxy-9,10-secoandrosta-1,3,5(10)-triene-9,17-dione 4,5-dioxygenase